MAIHIVLFEPEIPQNTGNIARTCAGTHTHLHLIKPLGFSTDDKMLKRAGCDYWPNVHITYHDNMEAFLDTVQSEHVFCIETVNAASFFTGDFSHPDEDYYFILGKETAGLPEKWLTYFQDHCYYLPQTDYIRSLNLSNTAAIIVYEALRQQGFPGL
ncbi:tRNA (cytidine/uridine-2'-O-)-methyltransferase [Salsuginibacillus halophilus]|uniref:Putative tRNA (cytidine(34)-2'-O)-methyltransferase n=1 Tax=Salsuginibacillus halophilus TaxID=517424 RepID=A0A2P8HG70_9BACI|nr:tRNA (cytidine(34)-2'-O)-methyltransferase [Salsuginibacillus halophilus]PSL45215.1 tRNA (cytidine/uridine-2'-O-)-methyltransferase [Salsuginibacillus halophilus]